MVMNPAFWKGRKVLVTGHTGFKGSWLCMWLQLLGAEVTGYAKTPDKKANLFDLAHIEDEMESTIADLANLSELQTCFQQCQPEIVFHLAAQALVRESYRAPIDTYQTNVMGTLNVLEACRTCDSVRSIILVSTDKCYDNKEWHWGYRESDPLGGYDPYSSSKACMELLASSYRSSFFNPKQYEQHKVAIATVRAGNVIGGGDYAENRIVPDTLNAINENRSIVLRNPSAVRPWQHVLEPLSGYLTVAEKLMSDGTQYAHAWNFGPDKSALKQVNWITQFIVSNYSSSINVIEENNETLHEAQLLALDCSLANNKLKWQPKWTLEKTLTSIIEWSKYVEADGSARDICLKQIAEYQSLDGHLH
jgi:CDP-glucose 4,6-dehydratase